MDENQQLRAPSAAATPEQRLRTMWKMAAGWFGRLSPQQRFRMALGVMASIVAFTGLLWYAAKPDTRVLYAALNSEDARQIAATLTTAGVQFEISPDGTTIRVPTDSLDKARLATTAKGGPKSGRMGFEIFDKPNWIGSEFDEKVNYQRALEGELEHTISAMGSVESARVHLTMPHDSLFSDQQRSAKGSVVLKLKHRSLSVEEADSVRNLVASAVDDLSPDNVILADADGHAVLGRKSVSAEVEAHEQSLAAKLVETLEPVAGVGNVRASVNVDYDTSILDETDETYDPTSVITLSMQKSQQTSTPPPPSSGVPGTASNAPNAQPPLFPSQTSSVQSATQESGTYGASKKTRRRQQGSGTVRRVTAAILVNDRQSAAAASGKPTAWVARDPQEMKRLTALAQAAIGYDQSRGDQISVENIPFQDNVAVPRAGFVERLIDTANHSEALLKYATILVAMLGLILFVIRPIAAATKPMSVKGSLIAGGSPIAGVSDDGPAGQLEAEDLVRDMQKKRAQSLHDGVIESINGDPALSSRLLHSWIHAE